VIVMTVTTTHYPPRTGIWPDGESLRDIAVKTLPGQVCPTHHVALDGGPVWFHCPGRADGEGHGVVAADLDHEYHGGAS
jgi:hypothetical protein